MKEEEPRPTKPSYPQALKFNIYLKKQIQQTTTNQTTT